MRPLPISWAASRFEREMKFKMTTWSSICNRLSQPTRTVESYATYISWDKEKQLQSKDVGFYICGEYSGGIRHKTDFLRRGSVTLDIDRAGKDFRQTLATTFNGVRLFWHTTRKHRADQSRIRVLFPLRSDVRTPDEYEALARALANKINIETVDDISYRGAQMMFFPSVCADGEFDHDHTEGDWLDPQQVLHDAYYDWHDRQEWPARMDEVPPHKRRDAADDPKGKPGMIGAFNRSYTITQCLEELIPGVYEPGTTEGRWRYHSSEGGAGAIVYDDDSALYSHHTGHDPLATKSVNAFDLVRVHKFGDLDSFEGDDQPPTSLPSFKAMQRYVMELAPVLDELSQTDAFDVVEREPKASACEAVPDGLGEGRPSTGGTGVSTTNAQPPGEDHPTPSQALTVGDGLDDADTEQGRTRGRLLEAIMDAGSVPWLIDRLLPQIVAAGLPQASEGLLWGALADRTRELGSRVAVPDLKKQAAALKKRMVGERRLSTINGAAMKLDLDEQGRVLPSVANMVVLLNEGELGIKVAFDEFLNQTVTTIDDGQSWQPLSDRDYVRLRIAMETRLGFSTFGGKNDYIRQATDLVAWEHRHDSAKNWLGYQIWDGVPRVERFFVAYMGAPDTAYHRLAARYAWTSLAGRVEQPGVKADMMIVLYGRQGILKTSAIESLVPDPEFYTRINFKDDDAERGRRLRGKLIAECPELRGLETAALENVKAILDARSEEWVPKYVEHGQKAFRRCSFWGSIDRPEFLSDPAGHRRFLPIEVAKDKPVDLAGIVRDRNQLWAEALELFREGGVDYRVERISREAHEAHEVTDSWERDVEQWLAAASMDAATLEDTFNGDQPFHIHDVLRGIGIDAAKSTRPNEMRCAAALRKLGYEVKIIRVVGRKNTRRWVKNDQPILRS